MLTKSITEYRHELNNSNKLCEIVCFMVMVDAMNCRHQHEPAKKKKKIAPGLWIGCFGFISESKSQNNAQRDTEVVRQTDM